MSEHDEITNQLVDDKVGRILVELGATGVLHELHITDQKVYNGMPLMLRAVLRLHSEENNRRKNEEFHQMLQMVIYIVDLVAGLRISPSVSTKCNKSRAKVKQVEAKAKQEELDEKKMEEKRIQEKLEREKLMKMTPEQQAKYEEKQKKKDTHRMKSKMMKVHK